MQIIRDLASAALVSDPALRCLLVERIKGIADDSPFDSTVHGYFVIVEVGDTLQAINAQVGFDLLSRTLEILEDCGAFWSLLYILDDSGYGVELFVPKTEGMPPELLALCQRYADQG